MERDAGPDGDREHPRRRTKWAGLTKLTAVGDLSRDGKPDFVTVDSKTGKLWLYKGLSFSGGTARVEIGSGGWNGLRNLTPAGDLNADKIPDLITVLNTSGEMYSYIGKKNGLAPHPPRLRREQLTGVRGENPSTSAFSLGIRGEKAQRAGLSPRVSDAGARAGGGGGGAGLVGRGCQILTGFGDSPCGGDMLFILGQSHLVGKCLFGQLRRHLCADSAPALSPSPSPRSS
ncbi:FG-GAP repeat domain-containing protein [Kribbella sp. NPDC002412]